MGRKKFHGGKNQFSSPCHLQTSLTATSAQVALPFDWLTFAVKLVLAGHRTKLYRECQPIKWECYLCTRAWPPNKLVCYLCTPSQPASLRVSQGKKIDFYRRGNWFLPPWKLIFTTVEIDFTSMEIDFYYSGKLIFYRFGIFSIYIFLGTRTYI